MKNSLKKLLFFVFIPFLLFFLGLGLSIFLNNTKGLSIIRYSYHKNNFITYTTKELYAGQKVSAEFTSHDKNLGIVSVRFYNFDRISSDQVTFRIKEKGNPTWFYENTYKVDQFLPNKLFTFGFAPIADSTNKIYYFEIQSLYGKKHNAITLSKYEPVFTTEHQYTKHDLSSPLTLLHFLTQKIVNQFDDFSLFLSSLIYFLPFIFYLIWLFYIRKYMLHKKLLTNYILFGFYIFVLLLSIFLPVFENNLVSAILLLLWIVLIYLYKFESSISFLLASFFLLFCPFFLLFRLMTYAENSAVISYLFLLAGALESVFEIKCNKSYDVTYKLLAESLPFPKKLFSFMKRKKS